MAYNTDRLLTVGHAKIIHDDEQAQIDSLKSAITNNAAMYFDNSEYTTTNKFGVADMPTPSYTACTANRFSDKPNSVADTDTICVYKIKYNHATAVSNVFLFVRTSCDMYYGQYSTATGFTGWEKDAVTYFDISKYSASNKFGIANMPVPSYTGCTAGNFSDKPGDVADTETICVYKTKYNSGALLSNVFLYVRNTCDMYYGQYSTVTGFTGWKKTAVTYFDNSQYTDASPFGIADMRLQSYTACIASRFSDKPDNVAGTDTICVYKIMLNHAYALANVFLFVRNTCDIYYGQYSTVTGFTGWTQLADKQDISALASDISDLTDRVDELENVIPNDLGRKYLTLTTGTSAGITFTWNTAARTCRVTGTATGVARNELYSGPLPKYMNVGDRFILRARFDQNVDIRPCVYFYDASSQNVKRGYEAVGKKQLISDGSFEVPFIVPEGAVSVAIRFQIPATLAGTQFDTNLTMIKLFKTVPRSMEVPLIVSFIDDDTTSTELVTKFHDSCCHNGIKGNFAVLTRNLREYEDGGQTIPAATDKDLMIDYDNEGFGCLIHADYQGTTYWSPRDAQGNYLPHTEEQINECRTNLNNGLRRMSEYGFTNFRYWVTPGGNFDTSLAEMAKSLGLKCLISTNNWRHNSLQDCRKYLIRRIALSGSGDTSMAAVKSNIDDMVADGGGWLIITTHYNDGWANNNTWDTTLDANGYPVGYARFNEAVQYAIGKGLVPMTIPQAWEYYGPILEANVTDYAKDLRHFGEFYS